MRTEEVKVFKFSELSDEAKTNAIEHARNNGWYGDAWEAEWRRSLDKASDALGFKVNNWSVGGRGTFCSIELDESIGELSGVRAWKWLQNNGVLDAIKEHGPFTGYCGDESLLGPLRDFIRMPDSQTLEDIYQDCVSSWAHAWERDMEWQQSDEYIAEDLEANVHEFTEGGRFWE